MRAIQAYSKSSSFFVSFFFITLLMLGVGFNTYTLNLSHDDLMIRETEAAIQADIIGFKSLYEIAGREAVINAVKTRLQSPTNDYLYHLKNQNDELLAGNIIKWPSNNFSLLKNGVLEIEFSANGFTKNGVTNDTNQSAIAMVFEFGNKDSLLVARSLKNIEVAVALAKTSSWIMIIILFLIAFSSLGVAYYVVSRINKIAETADEIIRTGDLSDRLYVDSNWDDLSKLTVVLNQLLEKIEHSVSAISSVSDNIAHDLRTPLTRLKGRIEKVQETKTREQLIAECDNILSIFQSLLRISDIENSAQKAGFKRILVNEIVSDALDLYHPLLESKSITASLEAKQAIWCHGDKDLLFQAFANVIDNAAKFTPNGGEIYLSLSSVETHVVFTIEDSGDGVNQDSLAQLTRRFYREDSSRSTTGNGLGLSLVQAIVELHDGNLNFSQSSLANKTGLKCSFIFGNMGNEPR